MKDKILQLNVQNDFQTQLGLGARLNELKWNKCLNVNSNLEQPAVGGHDGKI